MPEFNSRQAALIAAGSKALSTAAGKKRTLVVTSPATAAWAQNDTLASGIRIPKGSRFLCDSFASHAAFGASVTLSVGIRNFHTKAAITGAGGAAGLASAVDVSAAGRSALNNGSLLAAGVEYVATEDCEVYATLGGANPTDDAQIRLEVSYLTYD